MSALPGLLKSPISLVWLGLIAATICSLLLGENVLLANAKIAGALVIVVAFVKVRFVTMYFMELRDAPLPLKLIVQGYCVVVCAVLVIMLLVTR